MTDVVIRVPEEVAETLARLTEAVGQVVLVGGWAVQCRLKMARRQIRPTSDVDVILGPEARPARSALEGASAIQDDPKHPCRISGLPLLVDLLAERPDDAVVGRDDTVVDGDGLRLHVGLELRPAEKVASDGEDAVRLVEAFGALAVAHDLRNAAPAERQELVARLEQIGGSALAAQARVSGYEADPQRIGLVVDELVRSLGR